MKVLIVDDKSENLYLLELILKGSGYSTVSAKNGAEALGLARKDIPDLIITDILMPVMDGFTLCRGFKKDKKLCNVPFIFYTATYTDPKDEELALSLGADRYVLKPQDPEEFITIVKELLKEVKKKNIQTTEAPSTPETIILKEYNEALVRKLEDKMLQTEQSEKEIRKYNIQLLKEIEERKQTEEEIKKRDEQLIKLNAEKDKFFSIIVHDLKSPLIGFLGLTELMAGGTEEFSPAELVEHSKSLNEAAHNLYKLLENLLEWAQIQKGSINFTPKDSDLSKMVSQSIGTIYQRAVQKEIEITNEVGKTQKVYADEKMIGTVLRNLLSNAVKFTNRGGRVIVKSELSDDGTIEVSVEDNGVGIPENDVKRLFKIEEKVSSKGTDGELSTGLGLLLCKEFIEMHSGKIWVESEAGKGSKFKFTLSKSILSST